MKRCFKRKHKRSVSVPLISDINLTTEPKKDTLSILSQDVKDTECNVAGIIHPLRPEMTVKGSVPFGVTVLECVKAAATAAGVRERHIKFGVAQIGTRDMTAGVTHWRNVPYQYWCKVRLQKGELLRFRILPRGGGGGGGKNIINTVLSVVVAVVAVISSALTYGALAPIWTGTQAMIAAGVVGIAVTTVGMALTNAIAPVKPPAFSGLSRSKRGEESQVYSLSGGTNAANKMGRVPVLLGEGSYTPPLGAAIYTQILGEDQYLHMLLCLGIGDTTFTDIKIGMTPISDFKDVEYKFFRNKTGQSDLYPTRIYPQDLNIQLTAKAGEASVRTAVCDRAEIDLAFQGLGYFNDSGGINSTSVSFTIRYKLATESEWQTVTETKNHSGIVKNLSYGEKPEYLPNSGTKDGHIDYLAVGVSYDGGVAVFEGSTCPDHFYALAKIRRKRKYRRRDGGTGSESESYKHYYDMELSREAIAPTNTNRTHTVNGFSVSMGRKYVPQERPWPSRFPSYWDINVSGGSISREANVNEQSITISGAQSRIKRQTIQLGPWHRGAYDIRILRRTADSTDDRMRNDSYWTAVRSISNDAPCNLSYDCNFMAIKIRATGQLSGNVDPISMFYSSKILDWDKNSKTWVKRYTSNPASIFRQVLQDGDGMARPQKDALLDLPTIQEAHEYWDDKGWTYNLICDSTSSTFERLQSICASGLSSPTMVDGKWSIIIDKPRTHISMAFTSANSWSWSFKRMQIRLPQEIRCNFINRDTWTLDERIVPTDEPIDPDGQYLYETQQYEGVNDPEQIYLLARFHYADAKVRRRTISLRCFDESLLVTRGDLVHCACPNISPQGLQVGRVRRVYRDESDNVTHFLTDQTQSTDLSGRRFGVRVYTSDGSVLHAEVKPENRTQAKITLLSPQPMAIEHGDKYAFGDYSEEVFEAIVISLLYNDDRTCDVVLQDYQPQIYGDLSKPVPPFISTITKPVEIECYDLRAYEVWLSDSGSRQSSINVFWSGASQNVNVFVSIDDDTPKLYKTVQGNFCEIENVLLQKKYTIYTSVRSVPTKAPYTFVYPIGKQAPPSTVENFFGVVSNDTITFHWDAVIDLDLKGYELRLGSSWDISEVILSGITETSATWKVPIDGTYKFLIKAFDQSGNYSSDASTTIIEADIERGLNIVLTYNELPSGVPDAEDMHNITPVNANEELIWTPSLTNDYKDVGTYTNLSFGDYAGGKEDGWYVTQAYNLGRETFAKLRLGTVWFAEEFGATNLSFPSRTNMAYPYDTNFTITSSSYISTYYRVGNDSPDEDTIRWDEWLKYTNVVNIRGKFLQFSVKTIIDSYSCFISIKNMKFIVDVEDIEAFLKGEVIPVGGKTYYLKDIGLTNVYFTYYVGVTAIGSEGKFPAVEKFDDRFTVRMFDSTGEILSLCDINVRGY